MLRPHSKREPWHRRPTGPTWNVQNAGTAARMRVSTALTFLSPVALTVDVLDADMAPARQYVLTPGTPRTEMFEAREHVRLLLTADPVALLSYVTVRLGGTTGLVIAHLPVRK